MAWWSAPPAIVAEALVGVPDPLLTALQPGPPASGTVVASSLARSLAPPQHHDQAPAWLLPEQQRSFRRVLAAIRRHGGAVLADPVGSGKTFVALAVAAVLNRGPTACLVPAALLAQWEAAGRRTAIPLSLCSHEQVSRGRLPTDTRGLVIVDESHHFRNQHIRRYRHLAPWLVGRSVLLVTATPIVNRVADLGHQLLLGVRDNALILDGIVSLRSLLASGCPAQALAQLVVEDEAVMDNRPSRIHRISKPCPSECAVVTGIIEMLRRLRLSRCEPIAALIRGVFLRAAGSSPAAFLGALRRYRKLLLHAGDALRAGRAMDRAGLREFTGELGDQLIWWELLPTVEGETEIELGDLQCLEDLIRAVEVASESEDRKLDRLRQLLSDGTPTLVFTASRDTVRYVRDRLGDLRLAWCTGEHAGIGCTRLARRSVLAWFREPVTSPLAPQHLIVTDVAAEGLDLQRAARVIHYDLPWTPMRLEQREGRSVRYGSLHSQVQVVRFAVPRVLERSLRLEGALARKARLPGLAGLGSVGHQIWRWRVSLAERFGEGEARAGVAAVVSPEHGLLAGFALFRSDDPACVSATVLWLKPDGAWTEAPETIAARLTMAAAQAYVLPVENHRLREWLAILAVPIRERLSFTRSRRWITPNPSPAARRLAGRLQRQVREAARRHEARRLAELERALGFVADGHTAGEAALVERLAGSTDRELAGALGRLRGDGMRWDGLQVRLTGLVVFGPAKGIGTEVLSRQCLDLRPLSSTSTEP